MAKDKGFDTSKGVILKSKDNIDVEGLDYVSIEYLSFEDEKKLLNSVDILGKLRVDAIGKINRLVGNFKTPVYFL